MHQLDSAFSASTCSDGFSFEFLAFFTWNSKSFPVNCDVNSHLLLAFGSVSADILFSRSEID